MKEAAQRKRSRRDTTMESPEIQCLRALKQKVNEHADDKKLVQRDLEARRARGEEEVVGLGPQYLDFNVQELLELLLIPSSDFAVQTQLLVILERSIEDLWQERTQRRQWSAAQAEDQQELELDKLRPDQRHAARSVAD